LPQINLLFPTSSRSLKKAKKTKAPELETNKLLIVAYFPVSLILVFLVISWMITAVRISKYNSEVRSLKIKQANLTVNPEEIATLEENKKTLLKRLDFLERLNEKKFLWSKKLERISELIPEGIWLTDISSERKLNIDPVTRKAEGEEDVISVKGRAVALQIQDAIELIGEFLEKLKNDEIFSNNFKEIKLDSVNKGMISNRDIMNFEFVCIIQ
jgi:Tfp pilus assembly protein PilN